jgi:hypothetical protein
MRWKLLRRRLSLSAPRVIVRSRLPWPLRWIVVGVALGFSAALALWAFEFGKDIAGLDRGAKQELARLRGELAQLRADHQRVQAIANSADTLLKAEHAAQERLAEQVRTLEQQKADLARDLAFFEHLLPARGGAQAVSVRGFQASVAAPGRLSYQLLVMRPGAAREGGEFRGRYEVTLSGLLDGRPWSLAPARAQGFAMKQFQRLEGAIDYPPSAVVRQASVKVSDAGGAVLTTETLRLASGPAAGAAASRPLE